MHLGSVKIGNQLSIPATCRAAMGGAASASAITYTVYDDGVVIDGPTDMSGDEIAGKDGSYLSLLEILEAEGYAGGKSYTILVEATVDGVTDREWHSFHVERNSAISPGPPIWEFWKGEAVAANRTLYADLVLASDQTQAVTGAAPSVTIWKAGAGAFAAIAGAVYEVGFGQYRIVLDAADLDTEGFGLVRITAATAADRVVPINVRSKARQYEVATADLTAADTLGKLIADDLPLLVNRLGAFTGTGVETVLGWLKALADSGSTKPASWTNFQSVRDALDKVGSNASYGVTLATATKGTVDQVYSDAIQPVYTARLTYVVDDAAGTDEYTVTFTKNGGPLSSITPQPTGVVIKAIKRLDGGTLFGSAAMTKLGSTWYYKYDASGAARLPAGEAAIIELTLSFPFPTPPAVITEVVGRNAAA